jgi:arginyl-tRNA--protein-N-Asp/Glu arginylyltransferase
MRLEKTGFLTFINMTEIQKEKQEKVKPVKKDKDFVMTDASCLDFKNYFDEFAPYEFKPAKDGNTHKYTIEITRSVYTEESLEVFKKYEAHVHKKESKTR